jgi:hypothetical protein
MNTLSTSVDSQLSEIKRQMDLCGLVYSFIATSTTNGTSIYFEVNGMKYRFSDHSVTNLDRVMNEVHFSLPIYHTMSGNSGVHDLFGSQYVSNKLALIYKQRLTNKQKNKMQGWFTL